MNVDCSMFAVDKIIKTSTDLVHDFRKCNKFFSIYYLIFEEGKTFIKTVSSFIF